MLVILRYGSHWCRSTVSSLGVAPILFVQFGLFQLYTIQSNDGRGPHKTMALLEEQTLAHREQATGSAGRQQCCNGLFRSQPPHTHYIRMHIKLRHIDRLHSTHRGLAIKRNFGTRLVRPVVCQSALRVAADQNGINFDRHKMRGKETKQGASRVCEKIGHNHLLLSHHFLLYMRFFLHSSNRFDWLGAGEGAIEICLLSMLSFSHKLQPNQLFSHLASVRLAGMNRKRVRRTVRLKLDAR